MSRCCAANASVTSLGLFCTIGVVFSAGFFRAVVVVDPVVVLVGGLSAVVTLVISCSMVVVVAVAVALTVFSVSITVATLLSIVVFVLVESLTTVSRVMSIAVPLSGAGVIMASVS